MDINHAERLGDSGMNCLRNDVANLRRRRRALGLVATALFFTLLQSPSLWAQGPLQRLGERIRARAMQPQLPYQPLEPRVRSERPPLPPVVPPSDAGVPRDLSAPQPGLPGYRSPAAATGSANYNRARREPAASSLLPGTSGQTPPPTTNTIAPPPYSAAQTITTPGSPPPRARLGATVDTPPVLQVEGQTPRRRRGAWITEVQPQSPAEVAGLQTGDLIVAVQGHVITGVRDLIDELSQYSEGDELRIDYARNDALAATTVTLAGPDGRARQQPSSEDPTTNGNERSLLGGIGSIFGGLLGGQPPAGAPAPQAPPAPATAPQPPPPPQPTLFPPRAPLQPFDDTLETLPAPAPEQP